MPCFRKIPRREHEKDCITVGDHHCKDADQADSPSLVTCRSLDKLDDFTPLKRMSKLRRRSATRGEGIERDGQKAAAGLPWITKTAGLARCYVTALHRDPGGQTWLTVAMQPFTCKIDEKQPELMSYRLVTRKHLARSMSNYDLTRNNLDKCFGVTDKLRSLVTELKSELQTELIRLRL